MPFYSVKVKWGREVYPNIEVNTDEEPMLFKAQLYALTGVQPDRQKVMCKGITIKDDSWNVQLKSGATVLLLGSKEDVPQEPVEKPKFIEDMNESELATAIDLPAGLANLGNTCYMNATVQCLRSCRELREALKEYKGDGAADNFTSPQSLVSVMKNMFTRMESNTTVTPFLLLQTLHMAFPQFNQQGENGGYRQQDANECWSELMKMLQQKLPPRGDETKKGSFIEQYFGGTMDIEMKCKESPEEPSTFSKENFLQMSCFISTEVKYMQSGLKLKLHEVLTKKSSTLGRDAEYTRTSLISRLPAYLAVQFVRFQYKGKEAINAKILKDIKFPVDFDAFELCTPELQQKLTPMRLKFKELEDNKMFEPNKAKEKVKEEIKSLKTRPEPYSFEDDLGSNNSGYYRLQAVLTHQGRSSSSGHYVAWVHQKGDAWMKFDDDVVSPVTTEEILRLSGGGDWHCAYVLLYGPSILETPVEDRSASCAEISEEKDSQMNVD